MGSDKAQDWELLVSAGEPNPRGVFADKSPNVMCEPARAR
jgi:hypothetical protein